MTYFLQANAFLLFFYVLYFVLLRRETFFGWNRGYLLLSVGLSLAIPLLKMPEFLQRSANDIAVATPIEQVIVLPADALAKLNLPATAKTNVATGWGLWEWLIISYLFVVVMLLLRFLVSLVWLFRLGKGAEWVGKEGYYLAQIPQNRESFSFFRTLFLGKIDNLTDTQIGQIIQHELAHIRQRHSWDIVLVELVIIFFWINPIVPQYKKAMRKIHEYLADREALAYQNNKTDYAHLILKQSKPTL